MVAHNKFAIKLKLYKYHSGKCDNMTYNFWFNKTSVNYDIEVLI